MQAKVATIIVCLGRVRETKACLQSLIEDGYQENKILVVENGTRENIETLKPQFPELDFIHLPVNEGFTGGFNRGIQEAKKKWNPPFYFLLNNDTRIEKGSVAALIKTLQENPKCGIAAPKILLENGGKIFWSAGGEFFRWRFLARNRGFGIKDIGQYDRNETCGFLSGCAMMIRNQVIEDVGLFDDQFFVYSEDLDYSLRILKKGWQLLYAPQAVITHKGSVTSGGEYEPFQSFYRWRNRLLIVRKHAGFLHKVTLYGVFFPLLILRDTAQYARKKKIKSMAYLWTGFLDFLSISIQGNTANPLKTAQEKKRALHWGYLLKNPALMVLLKAIDFCGQLIFFYRPNKTPNPNPSKILIAKIDHMGDVAMSLHVLPVIKKAFPGCSIHYVCGPWAKPLLQNHPLIERVWTFDHCRLNRNDPYFSSILKTIKDFFSLVKAMRREKYDLAVDLRAYFPNFLPMLAFGNIGYILGFSTGGFGFLADGDSKPIWREGVHETDHFFDLLSVVVGSPKREKLELDYLINLEEVMNFLRQFNRDDKPLALIHPFCKKSNLGRFKEWKLEEWKKVVKFFEKEGFKVICTGDRYDEPAIQQMTDHSSALNLGGQTTISLLAGLIQKSRIVLSLDTFVSHLSAAFRSKTIVLFNEAEAVEQWKPWGETEGSVKVCPIESSAEDVIHIIKTILTI